MFEDKSAVSLARGVTHRLSIRSRPSGSPVMHQTWDKLLFLHWRFRPDTLRPFVPASLDIDTHDGSAWISVTPFTMRDVRPVYTPSLPGMSKTHELNVRTYVIRDGIPGVWFFSLDASNPFAVAGARVAYSLPYYRASMSISEGEDGIVHYSSKRERGDAVFEGSWRLGDGEREARPNSPEFFLVERYCLYVIRRGSLRRARIYHEPWKLRSAQLLSLRSTMLEAQGLPRPDDEPLIQAQAQPLDVEVWPLRSV